MVRGRTICNILEHITCAQMRLHTLMPSIPIRFLYFGHSNGCFSFPLGIYGYVEKTHQPLARMCKVFHHAFAKLKMGIMNTRQQRLWRKIDGVTETQTKLIRKTLIELEQIAFFLVNNLAMSSCKFRLIFMTRELVDDVQNVRFCMFFLSSISLVVSLIMKAQGLQLF